MCNSKRLCDDEECKTCFENSFASHDKSKYWSEKNGDVKPRQVFKSSHKKYWFNCECGHQFECALSNITALKPCWCPYCANKKLCEKEGCPSCFEKSFASHEKLKYWSEKNGDVKPRQVFKGTHNKYWFNCDCGHQFESSLNSVTGNSWCPYCGSGNKQLCEKEDCQTCFEKSFASHDKSEFWSEKNCDVKPRQVFKSSGNKYWFDCDTCGHQFESGLHSITGMKSWCPYCANPPQKICKKKDCQTCFEKSFSSHEKSKYWSDKNDDVKPRQVFKGSNNKYWFNCDCGHQFESILKNITALNSWCPYCANPSQKLCENKDCQICFDKSFASHEKSKYWSEKNGDVKPIHVFKSSHTKYWFKCDCGHQFESLVKSITSLNPTWCPYCGNNQLCENEDCKTCFEKSFASHKRSPYWSEKNGDVKPRQVFKSSGNKYWFDCNCGHQFESVVSHITSLKPTWCPYCANPTQKLCENEDCQSCMKKSFASHEKSKYWSDKNGIVKPRHVLKGSNNKYWFDSDCGHQFNSNLNNITGVNSWCPVCVNKTEKKIYEQLLQSYPNIISQFRADWCKSQITSRILPFDFVLEEQKVIIELDGNQHFVQVMNWKTPEEQFKNDQYKEKCANENGYSVIRIIQEDVWNDTYDWFDDLIQNIIKITSEHTIQNIYMGKKNEYKNFN